MQSNAKMQKPEFREDVSPRPPKPNKFKFKKFVNDPKKLVIVVIVAMVLTGGITSAVTTAIIHPQMEATTLAEAPRAYSSVETVVREKITELVDSKGGSVTENDVAEIRENVMEALKSLNIPLSTTAQQETLEQIIRNNLDKEQEKTFAATTAKDVTELVRKVDEADAKYANLLKAYETYRTEMQTKIENVSRTTEKLKTVVETAENNNSSSNTNNTNSNTNSNTNTSSQTNAVDSKALEAVNDAVTKTEKSLNETIEKLSKSSSADDVALKNELTKLQKALKSLSTDGGGTVTIENLEEIRSLLESNITNSSETEVDHYREIINTIYRIESQSNFSDEEARNFLAENAKSAQVIIEKISADLAGKDKEPYDAITEVLKALQDNPEGNVDELKALLANNLTQAQELLEARIADSDGEEKTKLLALQATLNLIQTSTSNERQKLEADIKNQLKDIRSIHNNYSSETDQAIQDIINDESEYRMTKQQEYEEFLEAYKNYKAEMKAKVEAGDDELLASLTTLVSNEKSTLNDAIAQLTGVVNSNKTEAEQKVTDAKNELDALLSQAKTELSNRMDTADENEKTRLQELSNELDQARTMLRTTSIRLLRQQSKSCRNLLTRLTSLKETIIRK